jgi:hypothetical protein
MRQEIIEYIHYIEPIQIYVVLTFIVAIIFYRPKSPTFRLLFFIVLLNVACEVITTTLFYYKKETGLFNSIALPVHHTLWLFLLYRHIKPARFFYPLYAAFILYAIINFFFLEGSTRFNTRTFIVGAFLYVVLFIYESFEQLKKENFDFFLSNKYLLLFAPVLFLFALSFIIGFNSRKLATTVVFSGLTLYQVIISFVNIIYYSLINIYIYREKKATYV